MAMKTQSNRTEQGPDRGNTWAAVLLRIFILLLVTFYLTVIFMRIYKDTRRGHHYVDTLNNAKVSAGGLVLFKEMT